MCIDVLWHATFPQRWSKSSVDSAVAGPLLSHWSSLWSLKGLTRELEKKKHEASMANQHMLTRVHAGTHTHTHARAQAVHQITSSHCLSHLHVDLSTHAQEIHKHVTAEAWCRIGDTHVELQHKASQCCSGDIHPLWAHVPRHLLCVVWPWLITPIHSSYVLYTHECLNVNAFKCHTFSETR